VNETEQKEIEKRTRGQAQNIEWFRERKGRVTASMAKGACGKGTSLIKKIITAGKPRETTIESLKYGIDNEKNAVAKYQEQMKHNGTPVMFEECGLFISTENGQLAASPDGIVSIPENGEKGCLEVKCLYKSRNMTPEQAVKEFQQKSTFPLKLIKDQVVVKEKHTYYYQMQMQMAVTTLPWCDFVIFTNKDSPVLVERVHFNKSFWESTKKKLLEFHQIHIVPALVCLQFKTK